MDRRTLAVKHRPKNFGDVVSQSHVTSTLQSQLEQGAVRHAYLFVGPSGCGKTTCARIFAAALNSAAVPVEIDAASNNSVDNIRQVIQDAQTSPMRGAKKVYILDECHLLSAGAFNALLKTLEEPPEHVVFILCTTDPQKIPATILSRVQRFLFSRVPKEEIVSQLRKIALSENITVTDDALDLLAEMADGGMREAITRLDTCLAQSNSIDVGVVAFMFGSTSFSDICDLLKAIAVKDFPRIMHAVQRVSENGQSYSIFVQSILSALVQIEKVRLGIIDDTNNHQQSSAQDVISVLAYTTYSFVNWFTEVNTLYGLIKFEKSPRTFVEGALLCLSLNLQGRLS